MRNKSKPSNFKTLKLEFCEKMSSAIFDNRIGVWALKWFSFRQKMFFYIWKIKGGFDYF